MLNRNRNKKLYFLYIEYYETLRKSKQMRKYAILTNSKSKYYKLDENVSGFIAEHYKMF